MERTMPDLFNPLEIGLIEDCPYEDITTELLKIKGHGELKIASRVSGIVSGTDRLKDFFESKKAVVQISMSPADAFKPGDILFKATGDIETLFKLWRISQTFLSLLCAIATSTYEISKAARQINSEIEVVVATRKTHFGIRAAEMNAVKDGGGICHRNSLSDTILITQNHLNAIGSLPGNIKSVQHKLEIEPRSEEEAYACAKLVDIILLDHFDIKTLPEIVRNLKQLNPALKVGIAGNINKNSIASVADAVDIVVLSSVLYAKPLDLTCKITKTP
jgi:nicotinate-nucleotide pyrophosphorylase (carboxylating)/molybdenum transport protein